jgi:Secretory lipase
MFFNNTFTTLIMLHFFKNTHLRYLLILLTATWLLSCNKTSEPQPQADKYLVSATQIGSYTKDQLKTRITAINPLFAALVAYEVKAYKIVYNTQNWDGSTVQASGLLLVPNVTQNVPMVSQQHGTIFSDADAPSYLGTNSEAYSAGSLFASVGYILACPDYIGYGTSNNVPHTYEHRKSLARASLDMLRASKEYISKNAVKWDNRLYITGYSEGGYATLSLQKMIEEEASAEFNLRASSCGSGAYDKSSFVKYILNTNISYSDEATAIATNRMYLWVLQTYDKFYKLNRPMSYYLKEPYATQANASIFTTSIPTSLSQAINPTFLKSINDGTDKTFLDAIADNNVHDWSPKTPTRLYHGTADNLVFSFNSQNTYDAMKKRGATNVNLFLLSGKTHSSAINDYLLGTYEFIANTQ